MESAKLNNERGLTRRLVWLLAVLAVALAGTFTIIWGAQAMGSQVKAVKVGLITDSPLLMDNGYNQMSYEGLLRAESELGVEGTVYTSTDPSQIEPNLIQCADDGNALCLMVGFLGMDAISNTAASYPGVKFAILDSTFEAYPDNLQGIAFAVEDPAYMAGVLAGKMTGSDVLGTIGGMPIPPVDAFIDGFAQGAHCANLEVTNLITYTNDFADPDLGAQVAQTLLGDGADVIFNVAGLTGNGAILTATQSGAWAVGVDVDQYLSVFDSGAVEGADKLLTSVMKRLDNAVFEVASEVVSGTFISGTVVKDLAGGGVDLAPYHEADASIPAAVKAAVEEARLGLITGSIDPYGPCLPNPMKIGLVTDSPVVMDNGFNQMSYEGLLRAESELGVEGTVYTSTEPSDIQPNLEECALDGNGLCLMVGWMGSEGISTTAQTYTGTMFAILDVAFDNYPDNLQGITFASQEPGYLAGTLAGKMTGSDVLGVIGGMPIPTVDVFIDGFENGALCANPQVSTLITYTNDFGDPELGAAVAQSLLGDGADVIFGVAGPTGAGAILTATQSGAWAVGVDTDQYLTVFGGGAVEGADRLLTSAMKRLDVATFQVISETVSSTFTAGTVVHDLASGGVDLAPYHETDAMIPNDVKALVDTVKMGLIDGSIDPYGACPVQTHKIYLPLVDKQYAPPVSVEVDPGASLFIPRAHHTATRLLDERILLVGGSRVVDDFFGDEFLAEVELFDPATNLLIQAGSLHTARHDHTATLLEDGRVLVVGGYNPTQLWLADAEIYDPAADTWNVVPPLYSHGVQHSATRMADGRVLVVGGCINSGICTERVEIFDPQTDTWIEATPLWSDRASHSAVLLDSGLVLIAGGGGASGAPVGGDALLYDPVLDAWRSTGAMVNPRVQASAVKLPDGRVLVAGGMTLQGAQSLTITASAEIYDLASDKWSEIAPLSQPRIGFALALLPGWRVLAIGGARDYGNFWSDDSFITTIEAYDLWGDRWNPVSTLPLPEAYAASEMLPDGMLWLTGGKTKTTTWSNTWLITVH
jgi:basic membrane protein A